MAQKRKRKEVMTPEEQIQRVVFHHYPTPSCFVRHALRYLITQVQPWLSYRTMWDRPLRVLDHSAGTGVWNAVMMELNPESHRVNVELQVSQPIRQETASEWHYGMRFQDWAKTYLESGKPLFDLIIGNFPFKEGQEFVEWGYKLLAAHSIMMNLAPINFLGTQERTTTLHRVLTPLRIIAVPKRLSFTKDGKTDEKEYVLLVHQQGVHPQFAAYDYWFDWSYNQPDIPEDTPFVTEVQDNSFLALWEGREVVPGSFP